MSIDIPTIETDRFRLRAPERRDFDAYAAMFGDQNVTRHIGGGEPRSRNESWLRFTSGIGLWRVLGYGYWVFAEKDSDEPMGNGGLAYFNRGLAMLEGVPEAGWVISPRWWGRGAATEIVSGILHWADGALPDPEIRCIIDADNSASQGVALKTGFRRIGEEAFPNGNVVGVYARPKGG
jgi:RimJ/RimL family protein N-acetyltransferase